MKVYVVQENDYQHTSPYGIWTDKAKALAAARAHGYDIDEYELDPPLTEEEAALAREGVAYWEARVAGDGSSFFVKEEYASEVGGDDPGLYFYSDQGNFFHTRFWAVGEDEALERAKELFKQQTLSGRIEAIRPRDRKVYITS